jgi:hypothetical protein
MATTVDEILVGTLGEANIALTAAVGLINPLGAQLDAMVAFGIGPLQADLAASLDASLALTATLSLQVTDPTAAIRAALQALIELQASLSAALALPPLTLSLGAEIGASAALAASLTAKLGTIKLLIDAAIAVKIPALKLAASLGISLGLGDVVVLSFDGINEGSTLADVGSLIQAKFAAGVGAGAITPGELASGVILVTDSNIVFTALGQLIPT